MELGLAGRTVIVTGGSSGIGAAVARAFGAERAHVVVAYHRGKDRAERVAEDVRVVGGTAQVYPYELAEESSAHDLVAAAVAGTGRLDVVVANAVRWWSRRPGGFETVPPQEWEQVVATNLLGAVRLSRAAAPVLCQQGWGRLVLMSSNLATDGLPHAEYYTAAKAGLHGLCRSLAWSLGPHGVLANVVQPGLTLTDRNRTDIPSHLRQVELERTPTRRLVTPEDVADMVVFLCSAANRGVTGEAVRVTGGR